MASADAHYVTKELRTFNIRTFNITADEVGKKLSLLKASDAPGSRQCPPKYYNKNKTGPKADPWSTPIRASIEGLLVLVCQ